MTSAPRWLFAVDPEANTAISRWPVANSACDATIARQRSALEAMVGEDYVILDTATHPDWVPYVLDLPVGADPERTARPGGAVRALTRLFGF